MSGLLRLTHCSAPSSRKAELPTSQGVLLPLPMLVREAHAAGDNGVLGTGTLTWRRHHRLVIARYGSALHHHPGVRSSSPACVTPSATSTCVEGSTHTFSACSPCGLATRSCIDRWLHCASGTRLRPGSAACRVKTAESCASTHVSAFPPSA